MDNLDESLDVDPNFEPQTRARSNTWPLPRPEYFVDKDEEKVSVPATIQEGESVSGISLSGGADGVGQPPKKNSSRRNAWGNKSYADLITQAIQSSPEKRLTLSQIYDWMVQNVAYFKDKGDSNSSAGWKNSIRHNLSLHNRFMRVQNEGTGKSSWWMVNPDAKPGKAARRRAVSMETQKFEKKRGRVKKKVDTMRNNVEATPSPSSSISEGIDRFPDSPAHVGFQHSPDFRPRASSNASSCSRLSPIQAIEDDGQDSQVPPLSPIHWQSETRPRASTGGPLGTLFRPTPTKNNNSLRGSTGTLVLNDRFCADQLVDTLAETMKLGDRPFDSEQLLGGGDSRDAVQQMSAINGHATGYAMNGGNAAFNRLARRGINGGNGTHPGANDFGSPFQTGSARNSPNLIGVHSPSGQASPQGMDSGNGSFLSSVSPQHSVSPGIESMIVGSSRSGASVFSPYQDAPSPSVVVIPESTMIQQRYNASLRATLCEANALRDMSPSASASASLGNTAQLMGHLFSLNNTLPNDVDLNTIQEGLECDVDQVIRHELIVEGNLDFNFEHQNAAANSVNTTMASNVVNRPWVH